MKYLIILSLFTFNLYAADHYKKVFPDLTKIVSRSIPDPISDDPVNTKLLEVYKGSELIGYIRELSTTTGCNSACLPLNYTTFYTSDGQFKKLISVDGLTKINHAPFTADDYSQLELLLVMAPKKFSEVKHPKEMTDAITGATLLPFKNIVVKGAAYSTLRVHLYNQQTMTFIKSLKSVLD